MIRRSFQNSSLQLVSVLFVHLYHSREQVDEMEVEKDKVDEMRYRARMQLAKVSDELQTAKEENSQLKVRKNEK